jgi:hypothetical protein
VQPLSTTRKNNLPATPQAQMQKHFASKSLLVVDEKSGGHTNNNFKKTNKTEFLIHC